MQNALFTGLVQEAPAAPSFVCACGFCAGSKPAGAGGNKPGDYATTPSDNAYSYSGQAQPQAGGSTVAALMAGSKWTSLDAASQKTVVTYSFADPKTSAFNYSGTDSSYSASLKAFSEADRALVRTLLGKISDVCNVQFAEVPDDATQCGVIRYGYSDAPESMNYAGFAFYPSSSAIGGDVWIDTAQSKSEWDFYRPNLLLHETLHALGLKHPFSGDDVLAADQDIIPNTVMSYSPVEGGSGTLSNYPAEPMVYDVAALQYLYGSSALNAGDTRYDLGSADFQGRFHTVWDAGGRDTLDASALGRGVSLDLNAGAHSEVGAPVTAQSVHADGSTTTSSYAATLTIAEGAQIEDAVGSAFNDHIVGNELANTISGGAGRDVIEGRGGDDVIDGGSGIDTAVYGGARAGYQVGHAGNAITVRDTRGAEGTDKLANVERVQFADGGLAFDLDGNAGTAAKLLGAVFGGAAAANPGMAGTALKLLDGGMDKGTLAQLALDLRLGAHASPDAVVDLVLANVLDHAPTAAEHGAYASLIATGQSSAASFALLAADMPSNLQHVNLVGLADTGLAYTM